MLTRSNSAAELVDLQGGIISREIFVNDEIYQQEQERIFARAWLFIGHESLIPNRGDFFTTSMGEESVILTRDASGRVHVFLNTCRHRGMKVCRYDEGNTLFFSCPYHGWTYGTDGQLAGVPYFTERYHERLDKSQWGLIEVAQIANYKGSIWATWDSEAPPFLDYLGGMHVYLDILLDCRDGREGGSEVIGGVQSWSIPCNWKFGPENFVGDAYHAVSHRSVDTVGIAPGGGQGRADAESRSAVRYSVSFPELGHGTNTSVQLDENEPYNPIFENLPHLQEYLKQAYEERRRRLGKLATLFGGAGTVFPNMTFQPRQPRSIAVWNPRGPHKTEARRFYLVDRDAPQELKDLMRYYLIRGLGPGGMTEQDDMENWNYASAASRGVIARRHPYNYQLGLDSRADVDFPTGLVDNIPSEQNQRGYYRRWAELMDAESWNDLYPKNPSAKRNGR